MNVEKLEISVRDIVDGYAEDDDLGVQAYGGKLNVRPAYQREFVYDQAERDAVLNTVRHNWPLNVMYWVRNTDGGYEMLDGQQRTISICRYVTGKFSISHQTFGNLTKSEQEDILNYKLMIYICEGTDKEKLDWFNIINTAGEKLSDQERRNAIYAGTWLHEAKKYFSKANCPAVQIADKLMNGSAIRQEILEKVLTWISARSNGIIEDYMSAHQHDTNCDELWNYFNNVIDWVNSTFINTRVKLMKGRPWGIFYNKYSGNKYNPVDIEKQIAKLLCDDEDINDITNQSGIYEYVLSGDEKHLSIRKFSDKMARTAYERQKGYCPICKKHFKIEEMQADHITPWSKGGRTVADNCQMLCCKCNIYKSDH